MESIVVYNNNVEAVLQKAGFKVGFVSAVDDVIAVSIVKLWYSGVSVIAVYYADNIVNNIKHCNDNRSLRPCDTSFTQFFNELKEIVTAKPTFPPSLLNTFTNILFDEYDANPVKLNKILMSVPRQDKEFIALFQSEIDQLTQANTSITTPEQFQFYREKTSRELHYVSEAYETTVLLHNLSSVSQNTKILDLRELSNNYVQVNMPTEYLSVIVQAIAALGEVTNPRRVVEILTTLGYKGLEAFSSVSVPHNIQFKSAPLVADGESVPWYIYFTEGEWTLSIGCDTIVGHSRLRCNELIGSSLDKFDSIKEIIRPCMFVQFATRFLSDLLSNANFALYKMPDVRTYCYQLLKAYDCIQAPPTHMLKYETTWDDVLSSGFDPVAYLEDKYHVDVSKLPTASVQNCSNAEDCDKLYHDLHYLLTLD